MGEGGAGPAAPGEGSDELTDDTRFVPGPNLTVHMLLGTRDDTRLRAGELLAILPEHILVEYLHANGLIDDLDQFYTGWARAERYHGVSAS